jgi:hypothetical protein
MSFRIKTTNKAIDNNVPEPPSFFDTVHKDGASSTIYITKNKPKQTSNTDFFSPKVKYSKGPVMRTTNSCSQDLM